MNEFEGMNNKFYVWSERKERIERTTLNSVSFLYVFIFLVFCVYCSKLEAFLRTASNYLEKHTTFRAKKQLFSAKNPVFLIKTT